MKERPVTRVDYSTKLCPVWFHDGTGSDQISEPGQLVSDNATHNIFVADNLANRIHVFNVEGNHLEEISTPRFLIGIALTDEFIFVSTDNKLLLKIKKSSNKSIKSIHTKNDVFVIESNNNSDMYVCEYYIHSIVVFYKYVKFQKRIKLNPTQVNSSTLTHSMKLHQSNVCVMFGNSSPSPPFHLQIFTLEGELVRCLTKQSEYVLAISFLSINWGILSWLIG